MVKKHGVRKSPNLGTLSKWPFRGVTNHLLTGMILQVFHWSSTWLTWKSAPWKADSFWKLSFSRSMLHFGGVCSKANFPMKMEHSIDPRNLTNGYQLLWSWRVWPLDVHPTSMVIQAKAKTTTERFLKVWTWFVNDNPFYLPGELSGDRTENRLVFVPSIHL